MRDDFDDTTFAIAILATFVVASLITVVVLVIKAGL